MGPVPYALMSRPDMSRLTVSGDIITGGTVGAPVADSRRVAQVNVL
jgi:hypothetical protein